VRFAASDSRFFNVEKFATATFRAGNVAFDGQAPARVYGELTLLGVTRPVSLAVTHF
jgi:polyisoprenoid-binding protein YceI